MRYLPHTPDDLRCMFEALGIKDIRELFESLPEKIRLDHPLDLPPALSEQELDDVMNSLSRRNADPSEWSSFLGAGIYRHHIPAAVGSLVGRTEFSTAYTPYQPEVSQGTLQAIFEFQTLVCQLTGMEVANASMYDGANAFAEGVLMTLRIAKKRSKALVARSIHPEYRATLKTYASRLDAEIIEIPFDPATGRVDAKALAGMLDETVASVFVQSPNFFGVVEDMQAVADAAKNAGALLGVAVAEPLSLALLKPPADYGAAVACGEGQSFGVPSSFGGPGVGFLAARMADVRNMPGRLCGETVDSEGKRGFVLTLATREQHIRREKATSNICTNQALVALMTTVYLSLLGKSGIRKLAKLNLSRAEYAKKKLGAAALKFTGPTFNEFVIKSASVDKTLEKLREKKIIGGVALGKWYPELSDCLLASVTETNKIADIDAWARTIGGSNG